MQFETPLCDMSNCPEMLMNINDGEFETGYKYYCYRELKTLTLN